MQFVQEYTLGGIKYIAMDVEWSKQSVGSQSYYEWEFTFKDSLGLGMSFTMSGKALDLDGINKEVLGQLAIRDARIKEELGKDNE